MTDADIEATKAPLIEHLMELRERLIRALLAFLVMFLISFYFAKDIYNLLVVPYTHVAGPEARLIYTAPQEYFFTQMKVALFTAAFLSCPVVFSQLYAFVAPGLYKHERAVFRPYLFATPIFFAAGALLVYFVVTPNLLRFFIGMQQANEPGTRADRAFAARLRISVADHDAGAGLRHCVSTAGRADAARAGRHRLVAISGGKAPLRDRARVHRRGDSDAARRVQPARAWPCPGCCSTRRRSFPCA